MSIKADKWIRRMAENEGMIEPFEPGQVRDVDGDLRTKLLAAMKIIKDGGSGLVMLSEDEKFRVAVAATMGCVEGEEKEQLEWEAKCLSSLNATLSGIPVDMEAVLAIGEERGWEPIGLLKLWGGDDDEP